MYVYKRVYNAFFLLFFSLGGRIDIYRVHPLLLSLLLLPLLLETWGVILGILLGASTIFLRNSHPKRKKKKKKNEMADMYVCRILVARLGSSA